MEYKPYLVELLNRQPHFKMLLNEHHIEALFYNHFHYSAGLGQYKKQWIHNQTLLQVVEDLNSHALRSGSKATLLKGSALLLDIYSDLGSRFLSDIDLLIDEKEYESWREILKSSGFSPITEDHFYANNFKSEWCKKIENIEINIELHTKLFFHTTNEKWNLTTTDFSNFRQLSKEDLLVHLCGHLAHQHTFLKLYWLFDIYIFYQKYNSVLDWNYIFQKSHQNHLFRSLQMCLWAIGQNFGCQFGDETKELFELEKKTCWKYLLTSEFLMNPYTKKMNYYLLKHAAKDHLTSALQYDVSWFYHNKIRSIWLKLIK